MVGQIGIIECELLTVIKVRDSCLKIVVFFLDTQMSLLDSLSIVVPQGQSIIFKVLLPSHH